MNILITGIHGFVGSNLVLALNKHYNLYGLGITPTQKEGVIKIFSWKDFENKTLPDVDAIIHLAGKAHDTKNRSEAKVYFDVNTGLTEKIYDYFLRSTAKKFIFFSSVKAAADTVEDKILAENIIPMPKGPYGESKIAAENYINNHPTKKNVYILRPCMIHGPGNKGNLNLLYNLIKKRIPWPLGAFENYRTFTSIDNLCYIIEGLLTKNVESGIYHIADDEALSTNELINIMCSTMNRKAHIWKINKGIIKGCARLGDILHLPLNSERLRKLTENYVASNAKIKKALGVDNLPVHAKDGLSKTIKYFEKKI